MKRINYSALLCVAILCTSCRPAVHATEPRLTPNLPTVEQELALIESLLVPDGDWIRIVQEERDGEWMLVDSVSITTDEVLALVDLHSTSTPAPRTADGYSYTRSTSQNEETHIVITLANGAKPHNGVTSIDYRVADDPSSLLELQVTRDRRALLFRESSAWTVAANDRGEVDEMLFEAEIKWPFKPVRKIRSHIRSQTGPVVLTTKG